MMKKWMPAVLCVVLMLSVLLSGMSVYAQSKVPFTLSVSEGAVGDTVTLSISLPENSRFTNATMYLYYNTDALTYIEESVYAGKISPKSNTMYMAKDYPEEGYVKCVYATGSVVKKEGILLNFEFEVLQSVPASFYLGFDECCGANEDDSLFDMNYEVVGCVLNNDGTVAIPTGIPTTATTTVTEPTVTTGANEDITTTTTVTAPATTIVFETLPTTIVHDKDNNEVVIPVGSTTDAQGNVATVPVATATDAQGNNVTIPVTIETDAQGNLQTVPITTTTDSQNGVLTTQPSGQPSDPSTGDSTEMGDTPSWLATVFNGLAFGGGLLIGGIVLLVVLLVVIVLTVVAIIVRKKKNKK